jgi:hypothetical protein
LNHQVINQVGVNALGRPDLTHRLSVTAVQCNRSPYPLAVTAAKPEPIRTPACIADIDRNPAIMPTIRHWLLATSIKQQLVIPYESVNPLVVE